MRNLHVTLIVKFKVVGDFAWPKESNILNNGRVKTPLRVFRVIYTLQKNHIDFLNKCDDGCGNNCIDQNPRRSAHTDQFLLRPFMLIHIF